MKRIENMPTYYYSLKGTPREYGVVVAKDTLSAYRDLGITKNDIRIFKKVCGQKSIVKNGLPCLRKPGHKGKHEFGVDY